MPQFEQIEHGGTALKLAGLLINTLNVAHQCQACNLAAGVELDTQRLLRTRGLFAVDEPDNERHDAVNACATAGEQQPRALLAARHQRRAFSIQYENSHLPPG